ncbi:MAG: SMI1/KNR4 family protein [Verrucomicrobia bacterium]|nr:SMI1/KNR4 family protein [Verrucomicrobiota bacterium]
MNINQIRQLIKSAEESGTTIEFYGPQSEETIALVEQALGIRFPREYRIFLREFGGGGAVDTPLSGIWPSNPFDAGRGSVFGDTVRARVENGLPERYVVVYRDDDIRELWVIDTFEVKADGTVPVLGFPAMRPTERCVRIADSYGALVEIYFSNLCG